MTQEELNKILENHTHWLNEDCDGWENMKANLTGADLSCADLHGADLRGADLSCADLRYADICYADLRGANLCCAYLCGADLRCADLRNAGLDKADLGGANLSHADLDDKEKIRKGMTLKNTLIGWKKCQNNVIVKLEIPRGAIVFSINKSKCRTNKAKVLEIIGDKRAYSIMHSNFSYYVGDEFTIYNFNCEYNEECAEGIHFFRTKEEAEEYNSR